MDTIWSRRIVKSYIEYVMSKDVKFALCELIGIATLYLPLKNKKSVWFIFRSKSRIKGYICNENLEHFKLDKTQKLT